MADARWDIPSPATVHSRVMPSRALIALASSSAPSVVATHADAAAADAGGRRSKKSRARAMIGTARKRAGASREATERAYQ